jgi:uncharacterized protein GlcG (DUF336 family)
MIKSYQGAKFSMANLSLQNAHQMIARAQKKAEQLNVKVSIFVVDGSGVPLAFVRMDGADISTPDIALAKAYTAVAFSKNTMELVDEMKSNPLDANGLMQVGKGKVIFIGGGVIAKKDGQTLGAIGVSGAEAFQDHDCGLEAVSGL